MHNLPDTILKNDEWHNDTEILNKIAPYIYLGLIKPKDNCPSINNDAAGRVIREVFSFNSSDKQQQKIIINTLKEGSFDLNLLNAPIRVKRIRNHL